MQLDIFDNDELLCGLWNAYFEARKNKRNTMNVIAFEQNLEHNISVLYKDISERNYKLSPSICFIVNKPVKREIFAAHFRDRIVHHYVINKLMPLFENQFIYDCYSCRKGKGTHFGVKRLEHFLRSATQNYTREAYILKLDLSGFFMSIHKGILWNQVQRLLENKYHQEDRDLLLYLLKIIILNNPTNHCIRKGNPKDWVGLPTNKSLFYANSDCGLPIGNLTSQVFANFYLTPFDRFVKEQLKILYYGRYVDDFFIIHNDKTFILGLLSQIKRFLSQELRLTLHPNKMYMQLASRGVAFLGYQIKPWGIFLNRRILRSFNQFIEEMESLAATFLCDDETAVLYSRFASFLGLSVHANVHNCWHNKILEIPNTFFEKIQLRSYC